jgi:outer membrane receptor for ferrienterochelin and colicin
MKACIILSFVLLSFTSRAQDKTPVSSDSVAKTSTAPARKTKPLYHSDSHGKMMNHDELYKLPSRDVRDAVSLTPGVYQARRGQDISIGGSRPGGTLYIEDGVQLQSR